MSLALFMWRASSLSFQTEAAMQATHPASNVLLIVQVQHHKLARVGLQPGMHLLEGVHQSALLQHRD